MRQSPVKRTATKPRPAPAAPPKPQTAKRAQPLLASTRGAVKQAAVDKTIAAPARAKSPAAKPAAAKPVASKPAPPPVQRKSTPAMPAGAYRLEDQIGFRLRKAYQRNSVIFNEVMARFDVTPTQFATLAKLDDIGSISQNQLGRLTAMDPATILGVVGRLVRQNLARARPAPEDNRLILIELTMEGKARIAEMKAAANEVSKRTIAPLTAAEVQQLSALLARLG